jgi:protein phosphatase
MVSDLEIGLTLRDFRDNPVGAADELVHMANENGGRDNVSVVVVKVRGDFPARAGWWRKLVSRLG